MTGRENEQSHEDLRRMAIDHLWLPFHQMNDFAQTPETLKIYESGEGCWLTDIDGRRVFDMMSGMWLQAVGYGRKEIADAVHEAMQGITSNPWAGTNPNTIRVSAKIASLAPDKGSRVFLTNGGAESNEVALKIAKKYHKIRGDAGRYKVVSRAGSYHGGTHATMAAGGGGIAAPEDYGPLQPGNFHVTQPNEYRCSLCAENGSCTLECARDVERVIEDEGPETVAAFIGEPMSITGGVYIPHDDYWPTIREICDRFGVLMIMDEVVTGYGRTGKWFASMHWDVQPDITTMAKQLSSGYLPAAGAIARKEVADTFLGGEDEKFRHLYTYGGHPIACAAALANLKIIEEENLVENSAKMGQYLFERLQVLYRHPFVGDIRGGKGLFAAVELVKDRETRERFPAAMGVGDKITALLDSHGLLTRAADGVIPILPPLITTSDDVDYIVEGVDRALSDLADGL